ncbi:hypothetical protein KA005_72230 [bacterium]|nr:hypothetical protein [bacterium]
MFFGLDWATALIRLSFQVVFAIVSAIPFYFAWNAIASVYFKELDNQWLHLPYWHIVSLSLCAGFIGENLKKLVPQIVSITQKNTTGSD